MTFITSHHPNIMESITAQIHLGMGLTVSEMRQIKDHSTAHDLSFDAAAVQFLKRGLRAAREQFSNSETKESK